MEVLSNAHVYNNSYIQEESPMDVSHGDMCGGSSVSGLTSGTGQPPAKYSDPSAIEPPSSLHELIARLHEVFSSDDISVEYVQKLMTSYKSNRKEWKRFAKFDQFRYTRNLVDAGNGKFNLMVLCWNEGQGSSIHSHANSHCFLKVLDGGVKEELFEWPDSEGTMKKWTENEYEKDQCAYINDSIGLHRVENSSHVNKAVTLHLYSPPFDICQCFDERTGRAVPSKVTFWSKYGRRTPFGRNPDDSAGCCVIENN